MSDEPKRLLMTEEGRLAASLAVARRQGPSDAELAELAQKLVSAGIALPEDIVRGAPSPAPSPGAPSARGANPLMKALLAGLPIVGIALIAGWLLRAQTPANDAAELDAPLPPPRSAPPPPDSTLQRSAPEPARPTSSPPPAAALPGAIAPSQEPEANAALPQPGATANERAATPANEARPRAVAEPRADAKPPSSKGEPASARSAALTTGPGAKDAPADHEGEDAPEATPESEIELLKRARNTLPADPARALALTERCAQLYPRGGFAQERDFIAISALFRVGRRHEALSRAERFRSSYPKSVYLPQLERMQAAP